MTQTQNITRNCTLQNKKKALTVPLFLTVHYRRNDKNYIKPIPATHRRYLSFQDYDNFETTVVLLYGEHDGSSINIELDFFFFVCPAYDLRQLISCPKTRAS